MPKSMLVPTCQRRERCGGRPRRHDPRGDRDGVGRPAQIHHAGVPRAGFGVQHLAALVGVLAQVPAFILLAGQVAAEDVVEHGGEPRELAPQPRRERPRLAGETDADQAGQRTGERRWPVAKQPPERERDRRADLLQLEPARPVQVGRAHVEERVAARHLCPSPLDHLPVVVARRAAQRGGARVHGDHLELSAQLADGVDAEGPQAVHAGVVRAHRLGDVDVAHAHDVCVWQQLRRVLCQQPRVLARPPASCRGSRLAAGLAQVEAGVSQRVPETGEVEAGVPAGRRLLRRRGAVGEDVRLAAGAHPDLREGEVDDGDVAHVVVDEPDADLCVDGKMREGGVARHQLDRLGHHAVHGRLEPRREVLARGPRRQAGGRSEPLGDECVGRGLRRPVRSSREGGGGRCEGAGGRESGRLARERPSVYAYR
mmetsp:Transcript_5676/g.16981  ORF Transcript_5676/g.16981 Transcript_5676/m.16981 type:complete len:427 (-) Transcript_5676:97-1377(-)